MVYVKNRGKDLIRFVSSLCRKSLAHNSGFAVEEVTVPRVKWKKGGNFVEIIKLTNSQSFCQLCEMQASPNILDISNFPPLLSGNVL